MTLLVFMTLFLFVVVLVVDAIILAVSHQQFVDMGAAAIRKLGKPEHVLYDLKYVLTAEETDLRL